ncbi:MAG: dihydrodipicolinate reductase [Rhodobacteraceae bacterium]|nr:dihydrodipicolinate reductase [Paracoccaceae bacterium]
MAAAVALGAAPAVASEGFRQVTDPREFVALVAGRALTTLGVRLSVTADGRIAGRAFGREVTGAWRWQERYFCREMRAGVATVPDNCQAVLLRGDTLRFISDRGTGEIADLRLR